MRIDTGDGVLDALLDLPESVRGDVDVLGGVREDVPPEEKKGNINSILLSKSVYCDALPCLDVPLLQGLLVLKETWQEYCPKVLLHLDSFCY